MIINALTLFLDFVHFWVLVLLSGSQKFIFSIWGSGFALDAVRIFVKLLRTQINDLRGPQVAAMRQSRDIGVVSFAIEL